jgi:glyoxylase-like metal-dependent hydrolase (beta-lactamase superfamily II)
MLRIRMKLLVATIAVLFAVACGGAEAPSAPPALAPGATWFDDWYSVTELDARTFAIAEPRYEQHNVNYLIVGDERAVLFDTGPGVRDIRPVVAALTDRPVIAAFSHLHYDHIGGQRDFVDVASLDHPSIRARAAPDGSFMPTIFQHGGAGRPTFRITEWWAPDSTLDLGGRALRVLSVPGHTPESLALYDAASGQLFTGDYLYAGDLFAFVPGSDLVAYRDSARRLLEITGGRPDLAIYGAHVQDASASPRQGLRDLQALERATGQLADPAIALRWQRAWFAWIPTRRYAFDGGVVILTPLF